jgi:hypothetical protein
VPDTLRHVNRIRLVWMVLSLISSVMWIAVIIRHGGGRYWAAGVCAWIAFALALAALLAGLARRS